YFEGRIALASHRERFWQRADWNKTVEHNRDEFRRVIGAVDQVLPPDPKTRLLATAAAFTYSLVEWPVLRLGSTGSTAGPANAVVQQYGILLESKRPGKHPAVISIPDADMSAADIAGLTARLPQREQYGRSLAVNGYVVLVPFFTQRRAFSQPWVED